MRYIYLIIACMLLLVSGPPSISNAAAYQALHSTQPRMVAHIEIKGLKKTQPVTVLRELPFSEGDLWQDGFTNTGERRLRNTGLFSEAVISPPDKNGIVHIRVRDRWSIFLLPEASRSDVGKTSAGITLTEHNMWGLNHELRIAGREETGKNFTGLNGTTISGSYLWRRIGDGPISLSVGGNTGRRVFDTFQNAQLTGQYKERNVGWRTQLNYAFGPVPGEGWDVGFGFSSDTASFKLLGGAASASVLDRRRNALQFSLNYQLLDDHITWITGTHFNYSLNTAFRALGSTINVYRHTASLISHIPIFDTGSTFDFRVSSGGASGRVLQDGLFDIGSSKGIRGYLPGELQGTYYVYSNLEARIPVSSGGNFQLVGFTDVGQIWNRTQPALGEDVIIGVGAGARLTLRWLVKGTFRSDVAYGAAAHNWRIYFGTAQTF
ncbi:MAG: hypothetical protein R8K53_04825 [Mariprofundaceae bacterium]